MSRISPVLIERRLGRIFGVFVLLALGLVARLVHLQLVEGSAFRDAVEKSRIRRFELPARRGDITDKFGIPIARSVDTYSITVRPSMFRETNRIDLLGDLAAAFLGVRPIAPRANEEVGAAAETALRLQRFHASYESRREWLTKLLRLAPTDLHWDRATLTSSLEPLIPPYGRLYLAPTGLGAHLRRALMALGDKDICPSADVLAKRLKSEATLGAVLAVDVDSASRAIEEEFADLTALAKVCGGDLDTLLLTIFSGEIREGRRIEDRLEDVIDDRIAVQRLGTYDLLLLEPAEREALARELATPLMKRDEIEKRWNALVTRDVAVMDEAAKKKHEQTIADCALILKNRSLTRLEDFEIAALAHALEAYDTDPETLKRALGQSVRKLPTYRRSDYISPLKEWPRRLQFKGSFTQEIARGSTFETAESIWSMFGLGRLGFEANASLGREYHEDDRGFASLLVGRVTKSGDPLGGLEEAFANDPGPLGKALRGEPGSVEKIQEPDESWREVGARVAPKHGKEIRLTIDAELQQKVEGILDKMCGEIAVPGDPSAGAGACVIDIRTGEILVLATVPRVPGSRYFDEYREQDRTRHDKDAAHVLFRAGLLSQDEYQKETARLALADDDKTFVERAADAGSHGYYPPGSVMKCFVTAMGLEAGTLTPETTHNCTKEKLGRHGVVDLHQAIVVSCNRYFEAEGEKLGTAKIINGFKAFGLFTEVPYLISAASARQRLLNTVQDAAKNDAIGQGSISTSPLEVARMMVTLARAGDGIEPRIVRSIGGEETSLKHMPPIKISKDHYDVILKGMRGVVEHYGQSDKRLRFFRSLDIAGKTGTAEGFRERRHASENCAWFGGFAPASAPRFAIAVFCEHTHSKGRGTAPYAAEILAAAFERESR